MRSSLLVSLAALSLLTFSCGATDVTLSSEAEADSDDGDVLVTGSSELGSCYCAAPYSCQRSRSPSWMYPAAHSAMLRAGVSDSSLTQTFGDASASVGTHCPESGQHYSAATDIQSGSSPCARTRALRMQGFAAFYRGQASFSPHIHAVYAGTPVMKSYLRFQIRSFLLGRDGLGSSAGNGNYENYCPITDAEKTAVRNVRDGVSSSSGGGSSSSSGGCVPGGDYCGGDKLSGNANTLYNCNSDGKSGSVIRSCSRGCSVNSGRDDSCRCAPGGTYCGGDVVTGNTSTLYRCGSDGVSTTVVRTCPNGCSVNTGRDDSCR